MRLWIGLAAIASFTAGATAQTFTGPGSGARAFQQLDDKLPTPNVFRAATGEPGPAYWQQKVDYVIDVSLDEDERRIVGSETITYKNNSPHTLRYLWVQLDQNRYADGSLARMSETAETSGTRRMSGSSGDRLSFGALARQVALEDTEYGFSIDAVLDRRGRDLDHRIVDTHMRVELPQPLRSGDSFEFDIDWSFNIIDESVVGGRGGYECFPVAAAPEDQTNDCIFFLAQWFPRMTAFTDYEGWHNKAFLGRGEFTLEFGDYDVSITVPGDHIVSASGVLQNPNDVLEPKHRERLEEAREAENPVFIVTPEEARENEGEGSDERKTWRFKADNVRDFAWASSRKFIWDAQGFEQDNEENPFVLAMSFYPNEAEPIWSQYSTEAVIHSIDVFNRLIFDYPYPVIQSVNTWKSGGMEYPMITFNGYRPEAEDRSEDGEVTYSRSAKYGLIGVIIHEVGHMYFPMVVNSDERQWAWMDEGLNEFLENVAKLEWEEDYPVQAGQSNLLDYIPRYMTGTNQVPVMTQADSLLNAGDNAYRKPASALLILRETVMGRELFDMAFQEYARRWKFKRATPSDFFRTMEDASGVDLDWFFRAWFYTTDYVDVAISDVREYRISTMDPDVESEFEREADAAKYPEPPTVTENRERGIRTRFERRRDELSDFYNENDPFEPTNADRNEYTDFLDGLNGGERAVFERALEDDPFVYFIDFVNEGGMVTPIPLRVTYEGGEEEKITIPAEIWRRDAEKVTKLMISDRPVTSVEVDPDNEIADAVEQNNGYPRSIASSRFELSKSGGSSNNQMKRAQAELKTGDDDEAPAEEGASDEALPNEADAAAEEGNASDGEADDAVQESEEESEGGEEPSDPDDEDDTGDEDDR